MLYNVVLSGGMHLYRVIFGDDLALQYVVTPTTDMVLMIPMTYEAITGIGFYVHMAGHWFSWFLLIVLYPVFLRLFAKLQYRN
jgi:hypothetical protein